MDLAGGLKGRFFGKAWHGILLSQGFFEGAFAISSAIRPVHVEKFPLLIAIIKVLGTGQKAER